jgi:hypothetical protein
LLNVIPLGLVAGAWSSPKTGTHFSGPRSEMEKPGGLKARRGIKNPKSPIPDRI